ncbi:MAG: hypothetical protein ABSF38_19020 [Verrucomicrobiota bacterium]|jgi:hypothetical protein
MTPNPGHRFPWKTIIFSITVVCIALIGAVVILRPINLVGNFFSKIPEAFRTRHITTTFLEDIPTFTSTHGNVLELATAQANETFTSEDTQTLLHIPMGTTTAEIRAPVTFRYHILLSDPWKLAAKGNICYVCAPQFRPTQPPAIETGKMEKHAESGWARFDKNQKLDELERQMTGMLVHRAEDKNHLDLVRESCRMSVAEFVKAWLIQRAQWTNTFSAIVVSFPDEQTFQPGQPPATHHERPTIQIMTKPD